MAASCGIDCHGVLSRLLKVNCYDLRGQLFTIMRKTDAILPGCLAGNSFELKTKQNGVLDSIYIFRVAPG